MIRNSLFATATLFVLILFGLMQRLAFLAPAKRALFSLWRRHGRFQRHPRVEPLWCHSCDQPKTPAEGHREKALAL